MVRKYKWLYVHYNLKYSQLHSQGVILLTAALCRSTLQPQKLLNGFETERQHSAVVGGADRSSVGTIAKSATVGTSAGRWVSTRDSIISQCTGVYHFHSEGRCWASTIGRSFAALDPAWRHHINNWQQCQEETPRWSSSCMWKQNRRLEQRHNSWSSIPLYTFRSSGFGYRKRTLSAHTKELFNSVNILMSFKKNQ